METIINFITQYYNYFLMFVSSAIAALLPNLFKNLCAWIHRLICKSHLDKQQEENFWSKLSKVILNVFIYIVGYGFLCAFAVFMYALHCSKNIGGNASLIFCNMLKYYFPKSLWEFVLIPIVVGFFTYLIGMQRNKFTNAVKAVVIVLGVFFLMCLPGIVNLGKENIMPVEAEILTELRTMQFPYEDRIFDIEHLKRMFDENEYMIEKPVQIPGPEIYGEDEDSQEILDKSIEQMSFRELLEAVESCNDPDKAKRYLARAYKIYVELGETSINDWNAIGRMFYYKGLYEKSDFYKNAANAFKKDNEYYNAALCYSNWYEESKKITYAQKVFQLCIDSVSVEGDNDAVNLFEQIYTETFTDGRNPNTDYLKTICDYNIDAPFLQTLNAVNNVADGDYGCIDKVNEYLQTKKYQNCPKLMLLSKVCLYHEGRQFSCEDIYSLYKDHSDFFELEDRLNLVWLFYESGEYVRAYNISKETSVDEILLKNELLLIRTESYLQDREALSEIDEGQLYKDITDSLEEIAQESGQGSVNVSATDAVTARLRLTQCILAGRIGIDASYSGLYEICKQLFNTDSNTGLYIIAALAYQDGSYKDTITFCNRIIDAVDSQDYFYNRVLLLKSDALVAQADLIIKAGESETDAEECYAEAERLLVEIRDMARNDYIVSSQRLKEVYERTERYDEAHEIEEELAKMRE